MMRWEKRARARKREVVCSGNGPREEVLASGKEAGWNRKVLQRQGSSPHSVSTDLHCGVRK